MILRHKLQKYFEDTVDFLIERHYVIVSVASVTMLCMGIYYVGGKKRKRAKRPSIRYGSLPKPKPKLYKVPLAAEPINQVLLSSDAVVFGVQIDHKKVQMTVANLLTNAACTAVDASPHCLRLPAFPQQVQHIINEIKNAKVQGKILLVEG